MLDTLLLSEAFHIFSEFSFSRTGLPIKIRRRKTKLKIDFFCIWFDAENRKSIENVQRVKRGRSTNLLRIKVAFIDITLVENFGIYVKWDFRQKESLRIFLKINFEYFCQQNAWDGIENLCEEFSKLDEIEAWHGTMLFGSANFSKRVCLCVHSSKCLFAFYLLSFGRLLLLYIRLCFKIYDKVFVSSFGSFQTCKANSIYS